MKLTALKVQISKKKVYNITINPQTTSYMNLKQHLVIVTKNLVPVQSEYQYLSTKSTWTTIRSEFDWQEVIQSSNGNLLLKLYKENSLMKSLGFKNGQGVSGMIKNFEHERHLQLCNANLEKLREQGFTKSQHCIYLLVKYKNDMEKVIKALKKKEIQQIPPISSRKVSLEDSSWIKVSKEPLEKIKPEFQDGLVKEKVEQIRIDDVPIFHLGFGKFGKESQEVDLEKSKELVDQGFGEDLVLFFLKKRNNDVELALADLKKTRMNKTIIY